MHKYIKPLIFVCLLSILTCLAIPAMAETSSRKKVTVMIYMCGADLESKNFQGTKTLAEINSTGFDRNEINVVALLGGATAWSRGYDTSKLTIVELGSRRPVEVGQMDLANMGEPDTLTAFLSYCRENYPAEKYDLIFWDHGGGPNQGVCFDWLFSMDSLSINELVSALSASPFADKGLDLICFNTCLTGSVEYAVNLAPFANYMVATADSMYGLDYEWLKTLSTDESSLVTASHVVDGTYSLNEEVLKRNNGQEINSVAAIDLSRVGTVVSAMDDFFPCVSPSINGAAFLQVSQQRRDSLTFGVTESGGSQNRDLADLGDLVLHLRDHAPDKADSLISSVREAVVYKKSVTEQSSGLTIYHPYSNKQSLKAFMSVHNDIPLSRAYSEYIQQFASILTDTPLTEWSDLHTESSAKKDNRTLFTLSLNESQAKNLAYSRLYVLHRQPDGSHRLVYDTPFTSFDGSRLTGEYNGTALYAVNSSDEPLSPPLPYELTADGIYLVHATLTKQGEEAESSSFTTEALIQCTLDTESRHLIPGNVLLLDEASGGYTGIYGMTLDDFSRISISAPSRAETYDDYNVLLSFSDWRVTLNETWEREISGDWTLSLLNDTIDTADLFASFQITDAQYNLYSSDLAAVKAQANVAGEVRVAYDDSNLLLINHFNAAPIAGNLVFTVEVSNLTEGEIIVQLDSLSLNGLETDGFAEAFGSGPNWGLLPGEIQYLQLSLPIDALPIADTLTDITFSLRGLDASNDEVIGVIPVTVSLLLDLSEQ